MTPQEISTIVNGTGLLIDIIAVIVLFFKRDKAIQQIPSAYNFVDLYRDRLKGHDSYQSIKALEEGLHKLAKSVNRTIEDAEKVNTSILKNSQKWLGLVVIGFIFQFVSLFIK